MIINIHGALKNYVNGLGYKIKAQKTKPVLGRFGTKKSDRRKNSGAKPRINFMHQSQAKLYIYEEVRTIP